MRLLADFIYFFAGLAYLPFALYNAIFLGKNRSGWGQRFGRLPRFPTAGRRIWVHAVSLGEVNATQRLIKQLSEATPDANILISTTTDTGFRRALELFGAERVFRFPLDFSLVMRRAFERVQPAMVVLVELEVWPNLVFEAARRGIPVVVVNGRLTERSAKRLAMFGGLIRRVFSRLTMVCAQDETIAARFRSLGVPEDRLVVTGSVKWDTATVSDSVEGNAELARAMGLDRSRPVLVCGSTGNDEERILLEVQSRLERAMGKDKAPRLVLVPRKPERFDEVAGVIASCGFACVRRSQHLNGGRPGNLEAGAVVLGDTMGELRKFYSLADVVFVGRSLVPMGGSDPMEAAGLGKPILVGPYTDNFRQPVEMLRAGGALEVVGNADRLFEVLMDWLAHPDRCRASGRLGQEVVRANQGATQLTVERLSRVTRESAQATSLSSGSALRSGGVGCYNSAPNRER